MYLIVYLGCKNAIQTIFSKTFQKTRCIRNDSKVFNKQYKQTNKLIIKKNICKVHYDKSCTFKYNFVYLIYILS